MKKMVYTNKIDDEIIFHENNMLALYLEKAKKYMPFFEKSGYSLKVGLMWKYFPRDTIILPEWLPVLCVLCSSKRWK